MTIIDTKAEVVDEKEKETDKPSFKERLKKGCSEAKDVVVGTARDIRDWCVANKEAAVILIPILAKCTLSAIRQMRYSSQKKDAEDLRNLYIYDRSLGQYWRLRREMTTSERLELERRKAAGEQIGAILADMRLI